jgi:hypothetical protein
MLTFDFWYYLSHLNWLGYRRKKGVVGLDALTVYSDVAAILQPLYQHIQAVFRQFLS